MFSFLINIFKKPAPKKCKSSYTYPKLSKVEEKVRSYLRKHNPAHTADLRKHIKGYNLSSVIQSLRKKGFVIDTHQHSQNTTYVLRNRKCR